MTDGVRVSVDLARLRRELGAAGARIERRAAGDGVRAAARVFRDRARGNVGGVGGGPRIRTGALRRAIVVARSRQRQRGLVAYYVGVRASKAQRRRGADPFYWRFLEGGWIPRGPGRKLRGGERSRALQRRRAVEGGARRREYPFLAPAFRTGGAAALAAFRERFNARLREVSR